MGLVYKGLMPFLRVLDVFLGFRALLRFAMDGWEDVWLQTKHCEKGFGAEAQE